MKEYYPEGLLVNTAQNRKSLINLASFVQAMQSESIMEANVIMCDNEHNLIVDLGFMRGIIPRAEGAIGISEGRTRDIALISKVGKAVCFIAKQIIEDGENQYALLSRKAAQQRSLDYITARLIPGDIIPVRITHLESFGAFCDIGCGNIALMPIDSISVSRISHPRDRFKVGQIVKAIISNIAPDNRITLSHKELLGTWQENSAVFSQGQTVSGIIRSIEEYGVFVELAANLAGLAESKEGVRVGQRASVYIKSIIPEKMKIKLIIIDSFDKEEEMGIEYFYEGDHIDEWIYSPIESKKIIRTIF